MRPILLFCIGFLFLSACTTSKLEKKETESVVVKPALPSELNSVHVVLIGEMHYYTPLIAYTYLLEKISAANIAENKASLCLAVEFASSDRSFEANLAWLMKRAQRIRKGAGPKSEDALKIDMAVESYRKIYDIARKHNFKVIAVDHPDFFRKPLDVDQRNVSISQNIAELLKKKLCSRVLGIFGKAHHTLGSHGKNTIKGLLLDKRISSFSVNLQMTNEETIVPEYKAFAESGQKASETEFIWLRNSEIKEFVKVVPNIKGDISTWQEFDYTLLIPSSEKPVVYSQ